MEIIDIIDEQNKVLYQVSKNEAHKKGLLHRTVIAEIIDSKGRYVLVRPRSHKQDAGQYVSPVGGHVKAGETEEEALKREALEEVGLKDFQYQLVGRKIYNRFVIGRQENHYFIVYEIRFDGDLKLGDEAADYRWFTRDEIKKSYKDSPKMFGDAYHFVLKNFYPHLLP